MSTFADAVRNTPVKTRTTNGMAAYKSTCRANVDLFGKIGAMRGKDITTLFNQAFIEDSELATRIALWARDVRQGSGERQLFRDILLYLEKTNPQFILSSNLLNKVPELGRWDDLLVFRTKELKIAAFNIIQSALEQRNGLAAKWMPRKGKLAVELREHMKLNPKAYRKLLVYLTSVVETQMCNREFSSINFSHVPSLAMSRYTKAFARNAPEAFTQYKEALKKGDPKIAKVNAGAVYPYDIIKNLTYGDRDPTVSNAQWEALPNYIGDANVLPVVDVSGSMCCPAGGYNSKSKVTCLDVAVSLGMYCSSKNTGKFKDVFLTFSSNPEFITLKGSLSQRYNSMVRSNWQMSTDLERAMMKILEVATSNKLPASEMPDALLIMSDMQFNGCVVAGSQASSADTYWSNRSGRTFDQRAMDMIKNQYRAAGYEVPAVIFWNLNAHDNVPVKFDESGVALVSGFSPAIMKSVLSADLQNMTPEGIMLRTVMNDRYDFR